MFLGEGNEAMLSDIVNPPEQPPMEQLSSPLSAQILEFCESDLFPETIQNSEVASSSNCCYEDQSSYTTSLSFAADIMKYSCPLDSNNIAATNAANITTCPTANTDTSNFSIIFDGDEITDNDISAPIDFSTSPHFSLPQYPYSHHQDQFDLSMLQTPLPLTDQNGINTSILQYPHPNGNDHAVPILGPGTLAGVCEDDCLSSMPPSKFMRLTNPSSPNCSFMDPSISSYLGGNSSAAALSVESSAIFNGNLFLGNDLQPHDLDFQGDNGGIFCTDPLSRPYNSNELQALSNESQHLVNGGGSSATPLASEITSLEADTFRVTSKLTTEERKEKIHRYMKKRNERNFSKKIKYACRKTLADSRPRVRGRFAKNDEFGETNRTTCGAHEEDTDEDVKSFHQVVVKEEDENFDSSDIFAHISGLNSFKCNYPIQSWI